MLLVPARCALYSFWLSQHPLPFTLCGLRATEVALKAVVVILNDQLFCKPILGSTHIYPVTTQLQTDFPVISGN